MLLIYLFPPHLWCRLCPYDLADKFLDKLAPPYVPEECLVLIPSVLPFSCSDPVSDFDLPFSFNELKGVISNLKDSAPGDDKIPYSFFAHLSDSSLTYYLNLINSMFITCVIPESWKKQIILPILKPGKSSSDVLSYRPIALSSPQIHNNLELYGEVSLKDLC